MFAYMDLQAASYYVFIVVVNTDSNLFPSHFFPVWESRLTGRFLENLYCYQVNIYMLCLHISCFCYS